MVGTNVEKPALLIIDMVKDNFDEDLHLPITPLARQIIDPIKWELEDSLEFNGNPDKEDLQKARDFGRAFAEKIKAAT